MPLPSYTINYTDPLSSPFVLEPYTTNGYKFPIIPVLDSRAVSGNTSILLHGKGTSDYGERLQEDIIHVMENFAGSTEPVNPIPGQLWYKRILYFRVPNGSTYSFYVWEAAANDWGAIVSNVNIVFATQDPTLPPTDANKNYWYNTTNEKLFMWVMDSWVERIYSTDYPDYPSRPSKPEGTLLIYDGSTWTETNATTGDFLPLAGGNLSGQLQIRLNGTPDATPVNAFVVDTEGQYGNNSGITIKSLEPTIEFVDKSTNNDDYVIQATDSKFAFRKITGSGTLDTFFELWPDASLHAQTDPATYANLVTNGPDTTIPNKKYVDDKFLGYLPLTGGNVTGIVQIRLDGTPDTTPVDAFVVDTEGFAGNNPGITIKSYEPMLSFIDKTTNDSDYVVQVTESKFKVRKITGSNTFDSFFELWPDATLHALTDPATYANLVTNGPDTTIPNKKYVDDLISNVTGYLPLTGGNLSGKLQIRLGGSPDATPDNALVVDTEGNFSDGGNDSGITIKSFEPNIVLADKSAGGIHYQIMSDQTELRFNRITTYPSYNTIFKILNDDSIHEGIDATAYATLVTNGPDTTIPNKKYVDDRINNIPMPQFNIIKQVTTTSASTTTYTVPSYAPGTNKLWVFINGLKQIEGVDYNETNSTTITFTPAVPSGLTIEVMVFA